MRVAVLADIHGNLPALRAGLGEIDREPADALVVAGDVVAGPLVALLVAAGRVPDGVTAVVEQGRALGRPRRIQVTVSGQRVRVSGSGLVVAEGKLRL